MASVSYKSLKTAGFFNSPVVAGLPGITIRKQPTMLSYWPHLYCGLEQRLPNTIDQSAAKPSSYAKGNPRRL